MDFFPVAISFCRICQKYRSVNGNRICKYCINPAHAWRLGISKERIAELEGSGVYLLHAIGTGYYKIGRTINAHVRFRDITRQFPVELRMLRFHQTEQHQELESGLHLMLRGFRGDRTEWFDLPERIAYRICNKTTHDLLQMINQGETLI